MTDDINFNKSECVQVTSHLTYNEYTNVCNGTKSKVSLGFWNISLYSFLLLLVVVLTIGAIIGIYKMITEW